MNLDILKGKWKQFTGDAKKAFGELTENELHEIQGDRDKFIGKVQEKYGIAKEEAEKRVDEFLGKFKDHKKED